MRSGAQEAAGKSIFREVSGQIHVSFFCCQGPTSHGAALFPETNMNSSSKAAL